MQALPIYKLACCRLDDFRRTCVSVGPEIGCDNSTPAKHAQIGWDNSAPAKHAQIGWDNSAPAKHAQIEWDNSTLAKRTSTCSRMTLTWKVVDSRFVVNLASFFQKIEGSGERPRSDGTIGVEAAAERRSLPCPPPFKSSTSANCQQQDPAENQHSHHQSTKYRDGSMPTCHITAAAVVAASGLLFRA
jgi:hypothetical protein